MHATYRLKTNYLDIYPLQYWNINLLLNTCSFYRKFLFIFSLNLSENTQNVHFRGAKFQNFSGSMPPDPSSVLAPLALHPILTGLTLNYFRRACYYQWLIFSMILRIFGHPHLLLCFSSIWFAKVESVGRQKKTQVGQNVERHEIKAYKMQVYQELIQYLLFVKDIVN